MRRLNDLHPYFALERKGLMVYNTFSFGGEYGRILKNNYVCIVMTQEELDKIWADCKAREEREEAEWEALPEEEKKRSHEMYDPAFLERISDDVTGGHDD